MEYAIEATLLSPLPRFTTWYTMLKVMSWPIGTSTPHTGGSMTRKGWLLFIAMSLVWGIPYLFIKIAGRELDPTVVVFVRGGIAAAILLPVAAQRRVLRQPRQHLPAGSRLSLLPT